MEPLSTAAHAALLISPADAKVALPSLLWGLEAVTLLAVVALIVALVPLMIVLRGTERVRRVLARFERPASGLAAPQVVWRAAGTPSRPNGRDAVGAADRLVAARANAFSDRG